MVNIQAAVVWQALDGVDEVSKMLVRERRRP